MTEEGENLEAEIVYPITCGDSRANLIWRKFVCPGINVKCVQVRIPGAAARVGSSAQLREARSVSVSACFKAVGSWGQFRREQPVCEGSRGGMALKGSRNG